MADGWVLHVSVRTVGGVPTVHRVPLPNVAGEDPGATAFRAYSELQRRLAAGEPLPLTDPIALYQAARVISLTFDLKGPGDAAEQTAAFMMKIATPQTDT